MACQGRSELSYLCAGWHVDRSVGRTCACEYRSFYEPVCRMTGQNAACTCACNDILKPCIVLERKDKVKRGFTLMGKLTFKYAYNRSRLGRVYNARRSIKQVIGVYFHNS